ncbi:MAG: hypothetical protein ACI4V3_07050 [Faecousia sp.]
MRTVIINTLGAAYSRKDVYFLAFAPEQILWLDSELDQLHQCVQLIRQLQQQQTVKQDYHLVILADLDGFEGAEYEDHRERLQRLLRCWFVVQLLRPLDEHSFPPVSVTEFFLHENNRDAATSPILNYRGILRLDQAQLPETVALPFRRPDGTEGMLDLTALFAEDLQLFRAPAVPEDTVSAAEAPVSWRSRLEEPENLAEELNTRRSQRRERSLEDSLTQTIQNRQTLRLIRDAKKELLIQTVLFQAQLHDQRATNADLQINLAQLIRTMNDDCKPDLSAIHAHDTQELAQLLADAEATLEKLVQTENTQPLYRKLRDDLYSAADVAEMELDMRQRLRKQVGTVPGVTDALNQWEQSQGNDAPEVGALGDSLPDQARKKLRLAMLRIGKEKARFQARYAQLQKEYNRETVLEDQRKIFDVCAGCYTAWRTGKRKATALSDCRPTEVHRPILEAEKRTELLTARDRCAEGVLERLDDFSDVRTEAAELHTRFSALTRLWSPDRHRMNARYFYRFSILMGLIFVILMILPFLLIEGQESGMQLPRIAMYLINFGIFLVLYGVGIFHWLGKLAKQIHALTEQLELLILQSEQARKESVIHAIETYARTLPACLIKQLNYDAMVAADEDNADAGRKYEQHMQYLKAAIKELSDVRTALRAQGYSVEGKAAQGSIDLLKPPYAPANQNVYLLFTERRPAE